jgi:MraZ protein
VARSFVGSYDQSVDAKGRVSIPASFRRVIEQSDSDRKEGERATLYIAYGEAGRPYLEGYSVEGLAELHEQINALPFDAEGRDALEDLYFSNVQDVLVDEDGRIVLNQFLRDKIGLTNKAAFLAKGARFEIWEPETYKTTRGSRTSAYLQAKGPDFNPRALLATHSPAK